MEKAAASLGDRQTRDDDHLSSQKVVRQRRKDDRFKDEDDGLSRWRAAWICFKSGAIEIVRLRNDHEKEGKARVSDGNKIACYTGGRSIDANECWSQVWGNC